MSRPGGIPSLQLTVWAFLLTISSLPHPSRPDTDTFVYGGCSQLKYTPGSPYQSNINSLLTSLANSATYSSYSNFTVGGPSPQDVVYGLYQCRGDLSMPDCAECVSRAVSQLGNICSFSRGAVLQLQGCVVKYDNTYFLGVEDKTVVLKKCGPSIGGYAEAMDRQVAVLAGLANGGGPYRVGGAGNVQGVAQCVGDLSPGECQDCVSDAIGRLRSDCGMAVSGDVFLAKCYASYSSGGMTCDRGAVNGDGPGDFVRFIANTAPRPIPDCQDGPGASCRFKEFRKLIGKGAKKHEDFHKVCDKKKGGKGEHVL